MVVSVFLPTLPYLRYHPKDIRHKKDLTRHGMSEVPPGRSHLSRGDDIHSSILQSPIS